MHSDIRLQQLKLWLNKQLNSDQYEVEVASADASFRRYFRIKHNNLSMIAMDAPPEQEDCGPFTRIAKILIAGGVNVPEIIAEDFQQGFLLLSDFGDTQYLSILDDDSADSLYKDAIDTLIKIQLIPADSLPVYSRDLLQTEMSLFPDWFINKHLKTELTKQQKKLLDITCECLTENSLQQPQVIVHRDYHSRNLMKTEKSNPGVLDFQDAVIGAVTYDLISLLKDSYICWPREQILKWLTYYFQQAHEHKIIHADINFSDFIQWFDLMAVQRHLKVVGIFSRLNIRDNKPSYMNDIPLTMQYIIDSCERYPLLEPLAILLKDLEIAEKLNLKWATLP